MSRLLAFTVMWLGCSAHTSMRGSVVMKINAQDAHVCLGNGEVHEGSEVELYRNRCRDVRGGGHDIHALGAETCTRERIAEGRVTQVLNQHYSVVQFPAGTPFQEGDTVEARR